MKVGKVKVFCQASDPQCSVSEHLADLQVSLLGLGSLQDQQVQGEGERVGFESSEGS